ncbi:unnamed protein product [Adineta steineri]|uniref:F-box domain-containing protein n=1 Tax=Adineta steineri TaxID=433720 RepID=A0A814R451_9BILA|nr:unnamed protein product [Adineta steineri]CAF1442784.1 unnamed protein product [Adineta steineri]CAF1443304.1 unnamed protein product [Adineta steineri]
MISTTFECLPVDVLFEIFAYLSPVNIVKSFLPLNKHFSRTIICEYLWHIDIADNLTSLSIFNELCQNVLKLIGARIVSLRLRLSNVINGWSLVSSSLRFHKSRLLRHLHLIGITADEFNKLLHSHLIKELYTLTLDEVDPDLKDQPVEGAYLAKVCAQLTQLRTCRLPFNFYPIENGRIVESSLVLARMILPDISNTTFLHTLTIGINTICFLEGLVKCIPFIVNLSFGIQDSNIYDEDECNVISLPPAIDYRLLGRLSRLSMNCRDKRSFYRSVSLLSSVFNQLNHFSLILYASTSVSDRWIISGDTIQKLCIHRLKPSSIYTLNLSVTVKNDLDEKRIFNSFLKVPFALKERPKVIIKERNNWLSNSNNYRCIIYTIPFNERSLSTNLLSKDLSKCCSMSINEVDLFPYADELFLQGYYDKDCFFELNNCKSPISLLVPWPLLTKISFDEGVVVSVHVLELILRKAYNVRTLHIYYGNENLSRSILRNIDGVGTHINEQIESFILDDYTLTLRNAHDFCTVLFNRLPNLKKISFSLYDSINEWDRILSRIVNGENKATKRIREVIHFLVDHFKQLVFVEINLYNLTFSQTHCFSHLIRRQIHQYPLSRPYRFQYSAPMIQIWL